MFHSRSRSSFLPIVASLLLGACGSAGLPSRSAVAPTPSRPTPRSAPEEVRLPPANPALAAPTPNASGTPSEAPAAAALSNSELEGYWRLSALHARGARYPAADSGPQMHIVRFSSTAFNIFTQDKAYFGKALNYTVNATNLDYENEAGTREQVVVKSYQRAPTKVLVLGRLALPANMAFIEGMEFSPISAEQAKESLKRNPDFARSELR